MSAQARSAVPGTRESATVTSLRQQNRAAALQFVLQERETTRAELARRCGFSSASAANITAELIEDGLIAEVGSVASRGGRPISLLAPRADGAYAIGVDVGERGVAVELFDLSLAMVDREFRGGRQEESPDDIHRDLKEAVAELRERNRERWPRVLGIGLGLPGVVETEPDGSQVLYAQSLGWDPRPIPLDLDPDLPVFAENGAKTQARAELWYGAARGIEHAVVALLGRGVGLGVISDGELEHGAFSSASEWGHTKIRYGGELCRCGQRGCVEAYLGADAILNSWRAHGGSFDGSGWQAVGALLAAADADPDAAEVVDDVLEALGAALGSVVNLTNPQRIVVGGWVGMRLMEHHADRIAAAIRRNCLDRLGDQFELVPATFGGDTVALGSALMPIRALIETPRAELFAV
ncbi:ROK family protein [Leifsonia sp. LS1]|uniref:ROK family protein n=1 Tax=Leifsonia sp. LS1 TaxID=2828483 RepID=UPI001CFC8EBF|nr:ROK family protein [Leifsonia sp. LS1]